MEPQQNVEYLSLYSVQDAPLS